MCVDFDESLQHVESQEVPLRHSEEERWFRCRKRTESPLSLYHLSTHRWFPVEREKNYRTKYSIHWSHLQYIPIKFHKVTTSYPTSIFLLNNLCNDCKVSVMNSNFIANSNNQWAFLDLHSTTELHHSQLKLMGACFQT